jgi:hypothetical protein
MKKITILLIALIFLANCASTGGKKTVEATQAKKGFLNGYYEKMEPGPEGGVKMRWIKPGVDFSRYNKVMLESIIFFFADDSEYKGIDAYEMKELADKCNRQAFDVLNATYPVVAEPGPDVIRIRAAITDLKQSRPARSAMSTVLPIGLAISVVKKGAGGSWTGAGETSAEFMVIDSMTNDVIAVAQDERKGGFGERFTKWGSTEQAFKFWAERMKFFLDQARTHRVKQ